VRDAVEELARIVNAGFEDIVQMLDVRKDATKARSAGDPSRAYIER